MNFFKRFFVHHTNAETIIKEQIKKRRNLEKRVNSLTQATLNGEENWFLDVVRKEPECAMRVIEECLPKSELGKQND